MLKQEILCTKPSYVGANVLDLSKLHMTKVHYDVIHATFCSNWRSYLIYSDPDSLVNSIQTSNYLPVDPVGP